MLTTEQLREAYTAAIAIGLDRRALLAAFERAVVMQLGVASTDSAEIWEDICSLNQMGTSPIRTWLQTAAQFAEPRVEASLFVELAQFAVDETELERLPWRGPWIGREVELATLADALVVPVSGATPRPVAICAVRGMAGVGKTYLAERFWWEHGHAFPGGVKRLAIGPDQPPALADLLSDLATQLNVPSASEAELRLRLIVPRALVHLDNADDKVGAELAAGLARVLPGCALIVTGRHQPVGGEGAWTVVPIAPFDEVTAMQQLAAEFRSLTAEEREPATRMATELGNLPLALSLAAAHLRDGLSPDQFLELLRADRHDIDHPDPAVGDADPRRRNIHKTLSLSLDLLSRSIGPRGEVFARAFCALGYAPAAGVGASLGAAICGLVDFDFLRLAITGVRLSLLERVAGAASRWRVHPLVAQWLRSRSEQAVTTARVTDWFSARLPGETANDARQTGARWAEVHTETAMLLDWLPQVPVDGMVAVATSGAAYATRAGPFGPWARFCERLLATHKDSDARSLALMVLADVARRAGDLDRAIEVSAERRVLELRNGRIIEAAHASLQRAGILQVRGDLDEALSILKNDVLPTFQLGGDTYAQAVALGKVADILLSRGEVDEALRIRTDELLPVMRSSGDIRGCAAIMGKIADVLEIRGEIEEALRIRTEDELPVYEVLGDIRECAIARGKIADILERRGQLDEALHIRADMIPIFETIGDVRECGITHSKIADILQARGGLGEALYLRRETVATIFSRLGDIRLIAMNAGGIAEILLLQKEFDEAVRIRTEHQLPVFTRLGDVHGIAQTMGGIADIHQARGEFGESLRIRRESEMPVYEKLGVRHEIIECQVKMAVALFARNHPGDRTEGESLLLLGFVAATLAGLRDAEAIGGILKGVLPNLMDSFGPVGRWITIPSLVQVNR